VPLEDLAHPLEVLTQHPLQRLGVQALAKRSGFRQVTEQDGDRPAEPAAGRRITGEGSTATPAEAEPVRVLSTTCTTNHHNSSLASASRGKSVARSRASEWDKIVRWAR
jgi:hypothetical protein